MMICHRTAYEFCLVKLSRDDFPTSSRYRWQAQLFDKISTHYQQDPRLSFIKPVTLNNYTKACDGFDEGHVTICLLAERNAQHRISRGVIGQEELVDKWLKHLLSEGHRKKIGVS